MGYLRALGEAGSDDLSTFDAEHIRCKIEARHGPHVADVVGDKHGISGTQILVAEIKLGLLFAQTTQGGELLLGLHDLHELLRLLDRDVVLEEVH